MRSPAVWAILLVVFAMFFFVEHATQSVAGEPEKSDSSAEKPSLQIQYNVVYGEKSEPMHRADIYRPKVIPAGRKLPGIILIHGGAWTAGDKIHDTQHAKAIAGFGAVVVVVNYRLSPQHPYPAQIDDCRLAYRWMIDHAEELQINTDALGAWGYSAGGHLAALLATDPTAGLPRLKVCVAGGAPCDLTRIPANSRVLSQLLGGTRAQVPERYKQASPVTYVSSDDPPMLLFHGAKDWLVSPEASLIMKESLIKSEVTMEHFVVPDKGHLMTFVDKKAMELSFAFLRRHLVPLEIGVMDSETSDNGNVTLNLRSETFRLPNDLEMLTRAIEKTQPTSINVSWPSAAVDEKSKAKQIDQIQAIFKHLGIDLYLGNERITGTSGRQ